MDWITEEIAIAAKGDKPLTGAIELSVKSVRDAEPISDATFQKCAELMVKAVEADRKVCISGGESTPFIVAAMFLSLHQRMPSTDAMRLVRAKCEKANPHPEQLISLHDYAGRWHAWRERWI